MAVSDRKKHVLIISGGSIDIGFSREYIRREYFDMVISADSGMEFCRKAELLPDLILGDFDSARPETLAFFREKCPERIETFPARKDWTDTELAIMKALEAGAGKITVLGGTGTRLDHVMGNIHLLKQALDAGAECVLTDPHNRIRMIAGMRKLKKKEQFGKYVSLVPFTPQVTGLTLQGFAYNVENVTLEAGTSLGISNEIQDEEAVINFREGILLVMESRD